MADFTRNGVSPNADWGDRLRPDNDGRRWFLGSASIKVAPAVIAIYGVRNFSTRIISTLENRS
jgi:hypothetical protein